MKKLSPFMKGTVFLIFTGCITKIAGFGNRMYLSQLIGAKEIGIYQLIMPVYAFLFSLCCQGVQTSLTKQISQIYTEKLNGSQKQTLSAFILRISIMITMSVAILAWYILFRKAAWIATCILRAPQCELCIKWLSYTIPFFCVKGCIHGYYLGKHNSSLQGNSQLFEQLFRIAAIYIIANCGVSNSSYTAILAVWGAVIGEAASCIYTILHHRILNRRELNGLYHQNETEKSEGSLYHLTKIRKDYTKLLLRDSILFSTNRLSVTLLQSVEAILIPNMLMLYYLDSNTTLALYGALTGMSLPFILFPSTVTASLSAMLLPEVASNNTQKGIHHIKSISEKTIGFCLVIGIFSTVFFFLFGNTLGTLLFHSKTAGHYIVSLSWLCPLIYLSQTLVSIQNGLGYTVYSLICSIIASVIRIAFILILVPYVGIQGCLWGMLCSYLVLLILLFALLIPKLKLKLSLWTYMVFPAILAWGYGRICLQLYQKIELYVRNNLPIYQSYMERLPIERLPDSLVSLLALIVGTVTYSILFFGTILAIRFIEKNRKNRG